MSFTDPTQGTESPGTPPAAAQTPETAAPVPAEGTTPPADAPAPQDATGAPTEAPASGSDPGAGATQPPATEPAAAAPAPTPPPAAAAPAPTPAPSSDPADLAAQVAALAAQLADLQDRTTKGQLSLTATDEQLAEQVKTLRDEYANWPQKGGMGEDKPQPWDLQAHGLPQPGVTRDYLPAGQPDELSPVVVAHSKPILAPGMAGTAVEELSKLLHLVGYQTSISKGINHASAFDDTVSAAVASFKRDFHVLEDPSQFPAQSELASTAVGPWVWEALIRAGSLAVKVL